MIAHWMIYSLLVGVLLSACAAALETALRPLGLPTRWAWAAAMVLTLAVPFAVRTFRAPPPPPTITLPDQAIPADASPLILPASPATMPQGQPAPVGPGGLLRGFDADELQGPLAELWLASSAALLLALLVLSSALGRRRRGWVAEELDGVPVLLSPDVGPAVVGLLDSRIVLPRWVLELDAESRATMLEHEREHLRAGDPGLLALALALAVLTPWNPAVWWQLRRLRLAMEVDCDARVLRRRDPRAYGSVLLEAGRRAARARLSTAFACAGPMSALERRIRIMTAPRQRHPRLQALGFCALAVLVGAAAWQAPAPAPRTGWYVSARPDVVPRSRLSALMQRYYPRVLREGMRADEAAVFVLDFNGELLSHTLVRARPGERGPDAAVQRELLRYGTQVGGHSSLYGVFPEFGPTLSTVEVATLGPTPADAWAQESSAARAQRRAYARALRRHYPPALRRAGIGGQVGVRLRVKHDTAHFAGVVRGDPRFFAAARAVADELVLSGNGETYMVITFAPGR
ncbi:MAG TPA: M56 family metallopeptidase [Longimicrobium sp.]|nr:M56 family metallopeptidase [Longimicrobium sp.]